MLLHKFRLREALFILSILCIPFVKAFTFKVGIPIKPTEIFLSSFVVISLVLSYRRYDFSRIATANMFAIGFMSSMILVSIVTLFYRPTPEAYTELVKTRVNPRVDSVLSLVYLMMAFLFYLVANYKLKESADKYLRYYIRGGLIACILGWYLFLGSFFFGYFAVPLLPGMFEMPQKLEFFGKWVIRCGTFQEGNPFGLFIATCLCISIYLKRGYYALFFLISSFMTLSIVAIFGCILIYNGLTVYKFIKGKLAMRYIPLIIVLITVVILAFSIESPVQEFLLSKVPMSGEVEHLSKMERKLYSNIAYDIGLDNILTGVGINKYSHYFQYYYSKCIDKRMIYLLTPEYHIETKVLPNNVYALILCEFGIVPFIIFIIWNLYLLLKIRSEIVKVTFLTMLLYFNAFPTLNLFFLWFFYAFVVNSISLNSDDCS